MAEPAIKLGRSEAATAQGAESRERILRAARKLVAERGYAGTSVGAICREAGVVRTSLYWHFGSKAGLLAALVTRVFVSWDSKIRDRALATADPMERLDRLIDGMREMVRDEPSVAQLLFGVALEGQSIPREVADVMREQREAVQRMIVEDFEASVGPLPDLDVVARLVVALNHDAFLMQRFDPDGEEVDRIFDQLRRAIVLIVGHRLAERLSAPSVPTGDES